MCWVGRNRYVCGSSGNDKETEYGSSMCTGDEVKKENVETNKEVERVRRWQGGSLQYG